MTSCDSEGTDSDAGGCADSESDSEGTDCPSRLGSCLTSFQALSESSFPWGRGASTAPPTRTTPFPGLGVRARGAGGGESGEPRPQLNLKSESAAESHSHPDSPVAARQMLASSGRARNLKSQALQMAREAQGEASCKHRASHMTAGRGKRPGTASSPPQLGRRPTSVHARAGVTAACRPGVCAAGEAGDGAGPRRPAR